MTLDSPLAPNVRTTHPNSRIKANHRAAPRSCASVARVRQASPDATATLATTPITSPFTSNPVSGQARILNPTKTSRTGSEIDTPVPPEAMKASAARLSAKSWPSSWTSSGT